VVVEEGREHIDHTIPVLVTKVLQTTAGRMIFARPEGASGDRRPAYLLLGLGLALLLTPLASGFPDGLERVAERLEFGAQARGLGIGLLSDYAIPGVSNPALATALAAALGAALLAGVGWLLARALARAEG